MVTDLLSDASYMWDGWSHELIFLQERTTDDSKESESFKELLAARTQEFIEEILTPHFGGMMTFVKEAELLQERGQLDALKNQEREQPYSPSSHISPWFTMSIPALKKYSESQSLFVFSLRSYYSDCERIQ